MITILSKVGLEGIYLNIIKSNITSPQLTSSSVMKAENISSKTRNKTRLPPLVTIIQCNFECPSHNNQKGKINKRNPNGKEEVKLSLFADNMIYT